MTNNSYEYKQVQARAKFSNSMVYKTKPIQKQKENGCGHVILKLTEQCMCPKEFLTNYQ